VYALTRRKGFEKDFALKDQIRRAAISVMSNISEGFESRARPQFINYLGIAKASAGEVRSQLYVDQDQGYLNADEFEDISDRADKESRQLYRLIQHLEQSNEAKRVRELPAEYVAD
jgi:four helix bundle protein